LPLKYQLIPEAQFKAQVTSILAAEFNGVHADGIVWWGADHYFYWMAQNHPAGESPYQDAPLLAQVFAAEFAVGETAAQHFTRIHKKALRRISDMIQTAEAAQAAE
jgi:hypothetical protein